MGKSYSSVLVEVHGRVGLVRLNRPQALNALNSTLMQELMDVLAAWDADPAIGAVVMAEATAVEMLTRDSIAAFDRIRTLKKPVIAAVSGWCLGGGNELAMSCDMIVASETARFGQPEINLGVIPGAGGTQRLTRAVGKAIAMEMVLNNRTLTAAEALHYGLVNRVVPVERYLEEALELAAQIAARAPLAVYMGKEAVNHAFESFLSEGIADERRAFSFLFSTRDQKVGMQAFIEKRKPEWRGE